MSYDIMLISCLGWQYRCSDTIGTMSASITGYYYHITIKRGKRYHSFFVFLSMRRLVSYLNKPSPNIPENNGLELTNPPSLLDEVVSGDTDPKR